MSDQPVFLAGCTASGKSDIALAVARRCGGEILAVDSMQVYRDLDIGTAKPSATDRASVPHHLLDLAGPGEEFDVARWLNEARRAEAEVRDRGRIPVFCGGTGFYWKVWFEGLGAPIPTDPAMRAELEARPLEELLEELRSGDPETFGVIDRRNPRRVVRAVEILRLTGRPRERRSSGSGPGARGSAPPLWCLRREAGDLRERVNRRVEAMFAAGWVEETRRCLAMGWGGNRTAMQAIGYRQVIEHLRGERGLAETVALVKTRTWQFARRQQTWFRHQLAVRWLDVPSGEPAEATAERVLSGRG